jgi:hypothetical protein
MSADRRRIEDLVVMMQDAFLDTPTLSLTRSQAQRRFALDAVTCQALLCVLVDTGVLTLTPPGRYARHYPRAARSAAA